MSLPQIISAIVTPFHSDGSIDFSTFKKLIDDQIKNKIEGIVVFGTTGECPTLTKEEKIKLLDEAQSIAGDRIIIIANVGTNCTKESVELAKIAKEKGVKVLLSIVPYYNRPEKEGIVAHFHAICDVGVPLIFYHHPKRTGITLDLDTIMKIASHPMVVGIKECSSDIELLKNINKNLPELKIYSGNDDELLEQKKIGIYGVISVVSQIYPNAFYELFKLDSSTEYKKILPLIRAIFLEVNPQGIKAALSIIRYKSMYLRLPMIPVKNDTYKAIEEELKILFRI